MDRFLTATRNPAETKAFVEYCLFADNDLDTLRAADVTVYRLPITALVRFDLRELNRDSDTFLNQTLRGMLYAHVSIERGNTSYSAVRLFARADLSLDAWVTLQSVVSPEIE